MTSLDGAGSGLIPAEEARARAVALVRSLPPELVAAAEARSLVLAEPIVAPFDLPRFDNAAMDGSPCDRPIRRTALPGFGSWAEPSPAVPRPPPWAPERRFRSGPGRSLRTGADAVARVEDTATVDGGVVVRATVVASANVRRRGEDVPEGSTLIEAGTVLGPGQIAAAAAF